jgi:hypothetical protein
MSNGKVLPPIQNVRWAASTDQEEPSRQYGTGAEQKHAIQDNDCCGARLTMRSCESDEEHNQAAKEEQVSNSNEDPRPGAEGCGTVNRTADGLAGSAAIMTTEPGGCATGAIARQRPPTRAMRSAMAAACASAAAGTATDARLNVKRGNTSFSGNASASAAPETRSQRLTAAATCSSPSTFLHDDASGAGL